jgi:hypothetical protein
MLYFGGGTPSEVRVGFMVAAGEPRTKVKLLLLCRSSDLFKCDHVKGTLNGVYGNSNVLRERASSTASS